MRDGINSRVYEDEMEACIQCISLVAEVFTDSDPTVELATSACTAEAHGYQLSVRLQSDGLAGHIL
jgi:hypothetical protein